MVWLSQNIIGIIGIIISSIIAYHVYYLSEKLDLRDRLSHKDSVRKKVDTILDQVRKGVRRKVELINVKKYFSDYPKSNERNRHGYTYLGAGLKALRFDGVEFFCGFQELYKNTEGKFSLENREGFEKQEHNAFVVGVILYEWIEYVDTHGDEYGYIPQFFTQFKGKEKSPYKYLVYYRGSEVYHKGSDPIDMEWTTLNIIQPNS